MTDIRRAMAAFLEVWIPELKKSIEMFTAQPITIERAGEAEAGTKIDSAGPVLWQGQSFEGDRGGAIWVGTSAETCTALTKSLEDDPAACESLYRELLEQSFEGAAQLLSSGRQHKLVRGRPIKNETPPSDLALESLWLVLSEGDRIAILVGIDSAFASLLAADNQQAAEASSGGRKADSRQSPPALECLTNLELPVSVVLGRAKVRIREALKLTAGSLIELDRRVGEPVEIIVHNVVVARGEVVSVKGNYGVRIQEVSSPRERFALQASAASSSSLARLQSAVSSSPTADVVH